MKKLLCIMFVIACFNVMPAYANHLIASAEADCNGITLSGTVCEAYCTDGTQRHPADVYY